MNDVERMLLEHHKTELFHSAMSDNFSFVDSLIDQRDLNKLHEEGKLDACND